MPVWIRKTWPRVVPFLLGGSVLLVVGALFFLAGMEHPGRFLLVAARGGRFVEVGNGVMQHGRNDCGPAALAHCLRRLGESAPYPDPESGIVLSDRGCRLDALGAEAARQGWATRVRRLTPADLDSIQAPAILHVREGHFLVLEGREGEGTVLLHDPAIGRVSHSPRSLGRRWTGYVLEFVGREGPESGR